MRARAVGPYPPSRTLLLVFVLATGVAVPIAGADPPPSVTVEPGDSWTTIRNRLFPLDMIRKANPGVDGDILRPGDVVRAPYVSVNELDRERSRRQAAERELTAVKGRLGGFEKDQAAIERRRQDVVRAEHRLSILRVATITLGLVVAVLLALLAFLAVAMRGAWRNTADITSRHRAVQARYDELRRSLHEVDAKLQQRVIALVRAHGGRVVTDGDIGSTIAPVRELTDALRQKHERPSAA